MHNFLSAESIELHRGYLSTLKLRLSVLEKSISGIKGRELFEIERLRIGDDDKAALCALKRDISAHEVFFSSFGRKNTHIGRGSELFGREAELLYALYNSAREADGGFLLVFKDRRLGVRFYSGRYALKEISYSYPVLALDLEEHAYFSDYRFDRDSYIKNALQFLCLEKL